MTKQGLPTGSPTWGRAWGWLWPPEVAIDGAERLRVIAGVTLGLLVAAGLSRAFAPPGAGSWLMAPLGASAVLVFALPASPLAQPWPVLAGNVLSALVAVAIQKSLALPWVWGAPLAAGIAVALMLVTRSLHPPGGAVAVLAVLSGADWSFAAHPVATNTVLLLAAATLFNRATGRRYPHDLHARPPVAPQGVPARFSDADLDKALQRYNQIIDVPRDDLRSLLEQAEMEAHARRIRQWRCADIMTPDPTSVGHHTPLAEAWTLMHTRRIKALPVVDRSHRVVGIVTRADFLRAADLRSLAGLDDRLRRLLRPPEAIRSEAAQVVGQIMTREVRVTQAERSLADLLPVFSSTGHHHLPVIDSELRLVGILTQTDVVRALMREASPAG